MNEYTVKRISHTQKHFFPDLFNQHRNFRDEAFSDREMLHHIDERSVDTEPVIFIVLRNLPQPIPVGYIQLCSICSSTRTTQTTIVDDLYVLPDHRKNGIALKLIEAAVKFAIDSKAALIQLETLRDNLIAQKLFESVGFKSQASKSESHVYSIQFACD